MKTCSLNGMSISCPGEVVLRVSMIHVHGDQPIRFPIPSNPEVGKEVELDDQ